jgi:uncharacterized protein (DUF2141 family)
MRYLALASLLSLSACALNNALGGAAQSMPTPNNNSSFELTLSIEGVRSAKGQIRAELLGRLVDEPKPRTVTFAVQDAVVGTNLIRFPALAAGEYAVQLYHDENANGKVDMNMVGVPTEGYAFSNTPLVEGGIPPFEKMSVKVDADSSATAVMAYAP